MKIKNLSRIGAVMVCSVLTFSTLNPTVYAADEFDPTFTDNSVIHINNDGSMIPDIYNSGIDPSIQLEKHYPTESSFTINGLVFMGRENMDEIQINLYQTPNIEDGAVFTIENIDFSNSKRVRFQDYNNFGQSGKRVTIIFKNCKFSSFYGEVNNPNFNTKFYDCDFNSASGTHMEFDRCKFHSLDGDMMNPQADVTVKNTYMYYDGENYTNDEVHVDGFQSYGFQNSPETDVENLRFENVRIEMAGVKAQNPSGEWIVPKVNAAIMLQVEFSKRAHDITLKNMHINGGSYSIYLWCKEGKNCETISNVTMSNIGVGYAHVYGIRYSRSDGVDDATTVIDNVDHVTSLYAGSAWKDSAGVHVSITNEILADRTMKCVANNGSSTTHTIPAMPPIPVNNAHHVAELSEYPTAADMPFDLDIVVADNSVNEVSCYDITDDTNLASAPRIRTAKFDPSITFASQGGQNQGNNQASQTNQTGTSNQENTPQVTTDASNSTDELPSELPATGGIQDVLLVALGAGAYTAALCYLVIRFSNKRRK